MNLVSTADAALIAQAMTDLWDTVQVPITIVKEPALSVVDLTGVFVPGYGTTSNDTNFTATPESGTFYCLMVEKKPEDLLSAITTKTEPQQIAYVKVQQSARDYIMDGRQNLHAIVGDRKYNIAGEEERAEMLATVYYVFKLEHIK